MTFKEWFLQQTLVDQYERHYSHEEIWNAATLAERERLEEVISVDYKFFKETYSGLPGEVGQYYAGRLDSYDEVLHVINNS